MKKCMIAARHWDHVSNFRRFSHPWLNKTNAHAFCSSFGYRYYSTRCWLVRHQLLTSNRWNKILRIHSGYDLSSGAVCRFCDSFLDSGHKKIPFFASSFCDGFISHIPRYRGLYIIIHFQKSAHEKGLAKAFQPCSNEYGMVWVKHF